MMGPIEMHQPWALEPECIESCSAASLCSFGMSYTMHEYNTFSSETLLIIFKIIVKSLLDTITIGYPHRFDLVRCVRKRMVTNAVTTDGELEYQPLAR
jgi:hypothetical protein